MNKLYAYLVLVILISFVLSLNMYRFFQINELSFFITILGLIYGLIAAFTINNAWERFSKIRDAIAEETAALFNMFSILKGFKDKTLVTKASKIVIVYCKEILNTEWYEYWSKERVHTKFRELFDFLVAIKIKPGKESILYDKCYDEISRASSARTQQLVLSQTKLSRAHWALIWFLSLVLVVSIAFLALPAGFISIFVSTVMIASIALILVVLYELDSLNLASKELSEEPYRNLISKLEVFLRTKPH